eukprot:jgi/Tetstr1/460219/TSEL_005534.t1
MHVDGCGYGWGAILNETTEARVFRYDGDPERHITFNELTAVRRAVLTFLSELRGQEVLLHEDNMGVSYILANLTSRSPLLMAELQKLWFILDTEDISMRPRYSNTIANIWADHLSRNVDYDDLAFSVCQFNHLDNIWGRRHTIDRFATMENARLPHCDFRWRDPCNEAIDSMRPSDFLAARGVASTTCANLHGAALTISSSNSTPRAVSRSSSPESAMGAAGTTGARAASPASSPRRSTFSSMSGPGASQRDHDGVPTGQEISERPQPRPRGGNHGLALTGLDALARLHSRLHDSGPARRGVALAAAWTVADALSVTGVAAGATWAPRIDAAAKSLQPTSVRHHPADVMAFAEVAAAWLAKARAVLAERHRRRGPRRAGGAGQSTVLPSPAVPSVAAFRGVAEPPVVAPAPPEVGWGAVDHLSNVDMVHMPAEMSMETAVPIEFQEAWAEGQRCVNERVLAAVEADDPVVLDRALKWKRVTELVRSWDDARTEALYAGHHARQRRTDADLFAALLVGTADTVVALLRDKHPSRSHSIPDAAYDIPVDEAALTVGLRVPYQQLKQHVAAGPSAMRNEYLRCLVAEYPPASGPAAVRAMSEVASMYLQGRMFGWLNRLFASARLVARVKKLGEGRAPDVRPVAVGEAERRAAERAVVDNMKEA